MSAQRRAIVSLDVGTTATKAAAFGIDSPWRQATQHEYPLLEPQPGWQVQEPAAVQAAVVRALRECVDACEGAEIVALSLSTAWHAVIGVGDDERPLTPIVTWADSRASSTLSGLRAEGDIGWLHQLSGTPVHPMAPLLKLRWFAEHEPALAGRVRWWLGLKDFLIWTLTGQIATELSTASGTGLLNRWTQQWSPQAAAVANVGLDRLPPIHSPSATLPLSAGVAAECGLPAGLPVVLGAADGPLGNVGTGALDPGVAGLSLGTSGAVRLLVDEQPASLDPSLFCYSLDEHSWVIGGAMSNGGLVVRWLGDTLVDRDDCLPRDAEVLAMAASVPAGSDGLVMLPYLLAERAPLWDPEIAGAYLGLRRRHTRAHLMRAGIEGVALQLGLVADRLAAVQPLSSVRATGGVFRSDLWAEVVAATLGRDLVVTGGAEGTALGAAAYGLRSLGLAADLGAARAALIGPQADASRVVTPDPAAVAAYARTRSRLPRLIAAMDAVGALFV